MEFTAGPRLPVCARCNMRAPKRGGSCVLCLLLYPRSSAPVAHVPTPNTLALMRAQMKAANAAPRIPRKADNLPPFAPWYD